MYTEKHTLEVQTEVTENHNMTNICAVWMFVRMSGEFSLTSLAMVVMKAGGRAVAMSERAWRDERAESAGGFNGKPMVTLWRERERVD